jgi:murein DD-endopeptidase MepM/ murein hydrolase activator NlpD
VTRVARLLHDDRCKNEDRECENGGEAQVHDSDRKTARDPDPSEGTDERIEEQGDEQCHEEDEDRVTNRSGHDPHEHEQQRQGHELHPARDDNRRRNRPSDHENHGIADSGNLFDDGNLALDVWFDRPVPRLKLAQPFDTVAPDMPSSRPIRRRRVERREVRAARRARRFALLTILAIVLVIALALSAFGGSTRPVQPLSFASSALGKQTRPFPQIVALRGVVRVQMPIVQTQATAIGYHSSADNAFALKPLGHQGNEGTLQSLFHKVFGGGAGHPTWYQLDGGATSALDVGAAPGTNVFAPVDGTVVGVSPYVVAGHRFGSRIDIEPQSAPSLIVSMTQVRPDPTLKVGYNVVSGATRIGVVVDLAKVEQQALARYTNDSGNHVSIELRPAASLVLN